jgi:hypothetical protein
MSATQQVVTIDDISADNAPAIFVAGGLNRFIESVKSEVCGEIPDLLTRKGRERVASLSALVSKRKTAIEKPGREYLKRLKEMPKVVEGELKVFVDQMDALRDSTRKPLTDWEAADVARRDGHTDAVDRLRDMAVFTETPMAARVARVIADLELIALDDSWEEFLPEAAQVKDKSLITLRALLADRTKVEADLAAIAKFNAEQAIRDQQERDAEIARAAVAEAQRAAAEAAKAERDAAAKREQALIDQAAQAQREADQKAREAETAAANQALQLQLAAEQAERLRIQSEADRAADVQRAEQQRIAAEQRQAQAVEQARLAEIARQEAEAAEVARQQKAREDDQAHKIKIMGAAKEAFIGMNISEELAKAIVLKIARGEVPNVKIHF